MSSNEAPTPTAEPTTTSDPSSQRRSQRRAIHGVLVAVDAPSVANEPWVVDAIDVNADGMGLVLPPELPEGTEVALSFKLGDDLEFSRLPATVTYLRGSAGGVQFQRWPDSERVKLLEFLVQSL